MPTTFIRLLLPVAALAFVACQHNAVTSVTLSETDVVLMTGDSLQLKAQVQATLDASEFVPVWSSDDHTVATVSSEGMVVALAPGNTVITVAAQGVEASCRVGVGYFNKLTYSYMRDPYSTGLADMFTLTLTADKENSDTAQDYGRYLTVELFVEPGTGDSLPQGLYTMVDDFSPPASKGADAEYAKLLPFTLSPGFVVEDEQWGTWLGLSADQQPVPMQSGTMEVSRTAEANYELRYELYDHAGNSYAGAYSGAITPDS